MLSGDRKPVEAICMPKLSLPKMIKLKIRVPVPKKSLACHDDENTNDLFVATILISAINFFNISPKLSRTGETLDIHVEKTSELFTYLSFCLRLLHNYPYLLARFDLDNPTKVTFCLFKFEKLLSVFRFSPSFYDKQIIFEFSCKNEDIRDSILRFLQIEK